MVEFIDRTAIKQGTPISRKNMMAIQGFVSTTTVFNGDGSVIETNSDGHTKTTLFNNDGSVTETFVGEKTITKTTRFENNRITEVVT